jgi:replication factor C subunit 3/5
MAAVKIYPMLWLEKYRPKSFDEITTHLEVVDMLKAYNLETLPNLIIHGQPGHNKKTLLYSLIGHLYGKHPAPTQKSTEMTINSNTITVNYLESEEMVEIRPSEYGNKDRHVVQYIIKEMAQSRPILSLFGSAKKSIKIIVIDGAEYLSKDAQAALRRTMEIYSSHFKIILVCNELSKLIEPIRSRCLFLRIRGFTNEEVIRICASVADKEGISVNMDLLRDIAENAKGNCRRALCILELYCFNREENESKKNKVDLKHFKLDWEVNIASIVNLISHSPKPENMIAIRKELYALINSDVPANMILLEIMRGLSNINFETYKAVVAFALGYDERLRLGTKPIYHIEAFAASAMCLISQKK